MVHYLLFRSKANRYLPILSPHIEVHEIDAHKLSLIRKKWDLRNQRLLLSKNEPENNAPRRDAKYFSDRNQVVEKEQRAKVTGLFHKRSDQNLSHKNSNLLSKLRIPYQFEVGDQPVEDKTLAEGSVNMLNANESVYYSFYARIYETLEPIWKSKVSSIYSLNSHSMGEYITVVDVVLDQEGNLVEVKHLKESGISELDRVVDLSWQMAEKFQNPPQDLLDSNRQVHMGWKFICTLGAEGGYEFFPPTRY